MTNKRLYLIRHGHTVWNGPPLRFQGQMDSSLSETGRSDAIALGKRMPYQPDRIISSPALRCRQTVDCLFGRQPDEIEPRCIEIGLGWCEGLLATEAAEIDANAVRTWQEAPWEGSPWGGESLEVLQKRVVAGVTDIVAGIKADERVFLAVQRPAAVGIQQYRNAQFDLDGIGRRGSGVRRQQYPPRHTRRDDLEF